MESGVETSKTIVDVQEIEFPSDEKGSEGITASQRVQLLFRKNNDDDQHESCPLFSEMERLVIEGDVMEWRETARWLKFEEDVEDGGNRWSKPHVSTLSLSSLFKLRSLLLNGSVILNIEATSMEQIVDVVMEDMTSRDSLTEKRNEVREALLKRHRHHHQRKQRGSALLTSSNEKFSGKPKIVKNDTGDVSIENSSLSNPKNYQKKSTFMRKISPGTEASNIMVGELDFLKKTISAFVRLNKAVVLENITEVPVPTRFLFILIEPSDVTADYNDIGRAMATIMSDEVFREVAYRAHNRKHLLNGLDEFLNAAYVLPPGEWNPAIRLEPPADISPQDSRKRPPEEPEMEVDVAGEKQKLREESGLTRTGVLFGGLMNDLRRKSPWYWSDFKDALAVQSVASWIFLYFACLSPIITFGGLLSEATGHHMGAMESLVAGFVCGIGYGFFSGQPLSILGSTGPVLIFETIVYDFCQTMEWDYLSFRLWIGTWITVILLVLVAIDASAFVCYITRFTEENFATLVALIYIYKAFENVMAIGKRLPVIPSASNISMNCSQFLNVPVFDGVSGNTTVCPETNETGEHLTPSLASNVFLMSMLLFIGTFLISTHLKNFKNAPFFPSNVRQFISDFAVLIAILAMTIVDFEVGIPTPKLKVPNKFEPTLPNRSWLVPPFNKNPLWSILLALPPALLGTILIFMDQQITAVIVNRKEFKLKKGCGYHLDLFVLSILIQICSIMGLPWFVAATVLSVTHVHSLKLESECAAPGDKPKFLGVREQRVTHIMIFVSIGLSVFLTPILGYIPMPVLFGVFLYMGISSMNGLQFFDRILIMFMPTKYQPDYMFLRKVPIRRVHLFTLIQIACLICLWMIQSFSQTSILFPIMLVVMVVIRKFLGCIFTRRELEILDDELPETSKKRQLENESMEMGCFGKFFRLILGPKMITDKHYMTCKQTAGEP